MCLNFWNHQVVIVVLLLLSVSCADDSKSSSQRTEECDAICQEARDSNATESIDEATRRAFLACVIDWPSSDYWKRVPQAHTLFLPQFKNEASCQNMQWHLISSPDDSVQDIQKDSNYHRFTADQVGLYEFAVSDGETHVPYPQTLEVIDALDRPFHNYNYFPSDRVATVVGDELWIAGVYTPQIARIHLETLANLSPILVGPWPTALAYVADQDLVLVAHKAEDTLGIVDRASGRLIDAIWVGDEPSNIIWDANRQYAYVTLSGSGMIAVVDMGNRTVIKHIDTVFDPLAMALDEEQGILYVASHRSGQSEIYPYITRDVTTETDIAIIDVNRLQLKDHMLEVASTLHAMRWNQGELWLTATTARPQGPLTEFESMNFSHELIQLNPVAGMYTAIQKVDLTRQASSSGPTATIQGFDRCGDHWWVVAEGSNQVVELAQDLSEIRRVEVLGRARAVVCQDNMLWVISSNRMQATRIDGENIQVYDLELTDTRSDLLREGLERFASQGKDTGANRSCNQCHVDGLSDGLAWNAGPPQIESRHVSRPFKWLEGTSYIGWDGYVGSVKISGYVGGATINDRGNTRVSLALGEYLASIMPAPTANQWTLRDGSLSDEASIGQSIFEGEAACASCHSGSHLTNGQVLEEGFTAGRTDIPSLVDVARLGVWYKTGEISSLRESVIESARQISVALSDMQIDAITQYMQELTGRDFFVLHANLGPRSDLVAVDATLKLTMSFPIWNDPSNLEYIRLLDANAEEIACTIKIEGRHAFITPKDSLQAQSVYRLQIGADFKADHARSMGKTDEITFQTARLPTVKLDGVYDMTVEIPLLDFESGIFNYDIMIPQTSRFTAYPTENGADVEIFYGDDMLYKDEFLIDGNTLYTRDLPIAVGPSFLNALPMQMTLNDSDGDGVANAIESQITLTGPGIELKDLDVSMSSSSDEFVCVPGSEGDHPPKVHVNDMNEVVIDWGGEGGVALLVTTPDAILPIGPGTVSGGETYWAIVASDFPQTFNGPIVYGQLPDAADDVSIDNGSVLGGADLPSGQCLRFSVVVNFQFSHTIIEWP